METINLTNTQEAFLSDLNNSKVIIASMAELQEKYAENCSKSSVKRDIDFLVANFMVTRENHIRNHNGKITSTTIYKRI